MFRTGKRCRSWTVAAVSSPTPRQEKALADVAEIALWAKATVEQRDKEMRTARKLGISLREIARAAHLGHTTVARIVGGSRNG